MLFDYRKSIPRILSDLRDSVVLATIQLSEDERNEPICERFRIATSKLESACSVARTGTNDSLGEAIEKTQEALTDLFSTYRAIRGLALDGTALPPEKELGIFHGQIPFKEGAMIFAWLENLFSSVSAKLEACDADMSHFRDIYNQGRKTPIAPDSEQSLGFIYFSDMRLILSATACRLENDKVEEIDENSISRKLRKIDYRIDTAAGGGLVSFLVEKLDPVEALSAPPPPSADEVNRRYDEIFRDLYQLLHGDEITKIKPLRETQAYNLGLQGSIRMLKGALQQTVIYLEKEEMEFPQYREVAGKERDGRS